MSEPNPTKSPSGSGKFLGVAILIAIVAAIIHFSGNSNPGTPADATAQDTSTPAGAAPRSASPPDAGAAPGTTQDDTASLNQTIEQTFHSAQPPVPVEEQAIIDTVNKYAGLYGAAANDMAKGGIRHQRMIALCTIMEKAGTSRLTDWIGSVKSQDATSNGEGILAVSIADHITMETVNNDFSDAVLQRKTLIPADSALFRTVAAMKPGEQVKFTANASYSSSDCLEETSVTTDGSMTDPEFIVRFDSVAPAQ